MLSFSQEDGGENADRGDDGRSPGKPKHIVDRPRIDGEQQGGKKGRTPADETTQNEKAQAHGASLQDNIHHQIGLWIGTKKGRIDRKMPTKERR